MKFLEGLKKAKAKVDEKVEAFKKTPVGANMVESFDEKPLKMTAGLGAAVLGGAGLVGTALEMGKGDDLLTPPGISYQEPEQLRKERAPDASEETILVSLDGETTKFTRPREEEKE